jgi:hypothetical protein
VDATRERTQGQGAALAALAELAAAAADPERRPGLRNSPRDEVPGFDALPEGLRATITDMDEAELAAIGKMCESLSDGGFFIRAGDIRLCMF